MDNFLTNFKNDLQAIWKKLKEEYEADEEAGFGKMEAWFRRRLVQLMRLIWYRR